jgi:hypothetical protein
MSKTTVQIIFFVAIASVLTTAVLGFSVMNESEHMMAGCFGGVPGASCSMLGPIEHFLAHLQTFQSISSAIIAAFLLVAATLELFFIDLFLKQKKKDESSAGKLTPGSRMDFTIPHHISFMRWLVLHEKRDPSFLYAMNR